MPINASRSSSGRLSEWLEWGRTELLFLDEREAREECEQILQFLLKVSRTELYLLPPNPRIFPQFSQCVQARKKRIPLAYLLGVSHFWEDSLEVSEDVLIPRPETEVLIESFLKDGNFSKDMPFRFLDLGTGSGNIAVTLAKLFPRSQGTAADLSERALEVADRNAQRLGVKNQLELIRSDGLDAFGDETFDAIFSNPPYVVSSDWEKLDPEVQREPRLALDGGEDGLDFYRKIFQKLSCLKRGGSLWVEIGQGQAGSVCSLFEKAGFEKTRVFKDFNQMDRIVSGINFKWTN